MGLIKGGLLFAVGVLLLISLFLTGVFLTLTLSLNENDSESSKYLSKDFWKSKFYFLLVVSFVLAGIMFFLTGTGVFLDAGIILVISALPLLAVNKIFSFVPFDLPVEELFLSRSLDVFWYMIFVAVVLVLVWLAVKAFKIGFFAGKIFPGKTVKSETKVKSEIKNEIKPETKTSKKVKQVKTFKSNTSKKPTTLKATKITKKT